MDFLSMWTFVSMQSPLSCLAQCVLSVPILLWRTVWVTLQQASLNRNGPVGAVQSRMLLFAPVWQFTLSEGRWLTILQRPTKSRFSALSGWLFLMEKELKASGRRDELHTRLQNGVFKSCWLKSEAGWGTLKFTTGVMWGSSELCVAGLNLPEWRPVSRYEGKSWDVKHLLNSRSAVMVVPPGGGLSARSHIWVEHGRSCSSCVCSYRSFCDFFFFYCGLVGFITLLLVRTGKNKYLWTCRKSAV